VSGLVYHLWSVGRLWPDEREKLTKSRDNEWTLVNAATLRGYSTTPISPSNSARSKWGCKFSASEKSTMLGWLLYSLTWRGAMSPLPSNTGSDMTVELKLKRYHAPTLSNIDLIRTFSMKGMWIMNFIESQSAFLHDNILDLLDHPHSTPHTLSHLLSHPMVWSHLSQILEWSRLNRAHFLKCNSRVNRFRFEWHWKGLISYVLVFINDAIQVC